jgi:hypothetical protein
MRSHPLPPIIIARVETGWLVASFGVKLMWKGSRASFPVPTTRGSDEQLDGSSSSWVSSEHFTGLMLKARLTRTLGVVPYFEK